VSRRLASSQLPYSKACDLVGDAPHLSPFFAFVDQHPDALAGQHAIRRWEYAMALYAITGWTVHQTLTDPQDLRRDPLEICDVGGAGSGFWQVLTEVTTTDIVLVDPSLTDVPHGRRVIVREGVEAFAAHTYHGRFDIITCISVIEHVEEIRKFFRACHMLLKPGGLLFLTTDYWDAEGDDTAHFHWMRKRIYNDERMRTLLGGLRELGYASFGQADWAYHGPQVYDYAVCSAAMVKK
jgi:SAM-dependent methyltransferase